MNVILWLLLIFVLIIAFWYAASLVALLWTHVPFVRTPKKIIQLILDNWQLESSKQLIELGCGEASFLRMVERHYPHIELIGYEVSLAAYFLAQLKKLFRRSRVKIKFRNFYKVNLGQADYIYCYLWPSAMERLLPKFETELKSGAEVVSLAFPIKAWKPSKIIDTEVKGRGKIYYYKISNNKYQIFPKGSLRDK